MSPDQLRLATALDIPQCISIRGKTRENPISESRLAELGITAESWGNQVESGELIGHIYLSCGDQVGYCFGDLKSGEIVVLAILPEFEGKGIGRRLLQETMRSLHSVGHRRLFLGCSSQPHIRSFGFYRHLGWHPTGRTDKYGDEELEYLFT